MIQRSDISAAMARIAPHIRRTPVLRLAPQELGTENPVTLKLEFLQVTGSFKPRGAFNRLLNGKLPNAGVIAASGGNHGAAVAYAAQALGVAAEIFVPAPTPAVKRNRIEGFGAKLVVGGASYEEARLASEARATQTGALLVHAYDQAEVVTGQGTIGLELEQDAPELTHVLVAAGGGGLFGGIGAWYAGRAGLVVVEPESCATLAAAQRASAPVDVPVGGIAADSLGARRAGHIAFDVMRHCNALCVTIPDEAIVGARRWLWERLRIVAEPGGATALAALLSGAWRAPSGAHIGIVLCGANCEPGSVI